MSAVKDLCDGILKSVVQTGCLNDASVEKQKEACEIMKRHVTDLVTKSDGQYAEHREAVLNGTIHQGYVIADVVANCVLEINAI